MKPITGIKAMRGFGVVLLVGGAAVTWQLDHRDSLGPTSSPELTAAAAPTAPQTSQSAYQPVRGARVVRGPLRIGDETLPDRILVPLEAIITRGTQRREVIFLFEGSGTGLNGLAEWRYVATGRRNETHVEIVGSNELPAPEPGDIVLIEGHQYLAHETPIQLIETVPPNGDGSGG